MTTNVQFEDGLVSIMRTAGVSIARPARMTRLELGLVLHGLAGTLIAEGVERASANGNGAAPRAAVAAAIGASRFAGLEIVEPATQSPQGKDRKTTADRRGLPRRKVVKRSRNGKTETLSCGHRISPVPANWKKHKSRACSQCTPVTTS